jgi:hypothetical protein
VSDLPPLLDPDSLGALGADDGLLSVDDDPLSLAEPAWGPDPWEELRTKPPSGSAEADLDEEVRALGDALASVPSEEDRGFRDRLQTELRRFALATDSEYWVCLCFLSRAHKQAFLRATGLDKLGDKYLDGHKAARILDVALPPWNVETK